MPGESPRQPFTQEVIGQTVGAYEGDYRTQVQYRAKGLSHRLLNAFKPFLALAIAVNASGLMLLGTCQHAFAATESASISTALQVYQSDRSSILLLAIFCGAISFSFLAVFWMIRERGRIVEDNNRLRQGFSGMRADRDRLAALLEVDDIRVIVWNGENAQAQVLGTLNAAAGTPQNQNDFLAFGKWLSPASVMELQDAVLLLREDGQQFSLELASRSGSTLEAQGRVSGGQAFVRFVALDGARESLANVNAPFLGYRRAV